MALRQQQECKRTKSTRLVPGIVIIILAAIFTGYTGVQLGDNWTLMQKRWPEYKKHCRRPYPEMAYRAMGPKAKYVRFQG
ncbi:hypothetical protein ANCDUO_13304 [Ancylostoma duodenale]|uniref:Amino acid transporter transmembrane domain-containing protein n=1 Tax=Ancylostoma duodenale TaxID=51022 RepID=A0A0C2G6A9_9BILA|nr:hypothetical protein ANCDUO_13304 [Ancylostoma duodenale]